MKNLRNNQAESGVRNGPKMFKNPKGHKKRFGGVNVGKRYLSDYC